MTTMVGIHQQQDKVDQLYVNMGLHAAPLTAVGPFATKEEALRWQQELLAKIQDCEIIEPIGPDGENVPWYGFSFQKD